MRKLVSAEVEFLLGLLSILLVAFLIPLIVSIADSSSWPFLGYLYLPIGIAVTLHALGDTLDSKEKESVLSGMGMLGRVLNRKEEEKELKETE